MGMRQVSLFRFVDEVNSIYASRNIDRTTLGILDSNRGIYWSPNVICLSLILLCLCFFEVICKKKLCNRSIYIYIYRDKNRKFSLILKKKKKNVHLDIYPKKQSNLYNQAIFDQASLSVEKLIKFFPSLLINTVRNLIRNRIST